MGCPALYLFMHVQSGQAIASALCLHGAQHARSDMASSFSSMASLIDW
jgi:hypothetical protein